MRSQQQQQPTVAPGPVSLSFVGCGNVLPAYLETAGRLVGSAAARVVAFCGREHQRERFKKEWPGAVFHTRYEAMLADPAIDAVVVLTPMGQHGAMVDAALRAGKHVLVEKPLATRLDEARRLVTLAGRRGLTLFAAPFTTLSPTFARIGSRLHAGDIGDVVSGRARYGWAGPDWSSWFYGRDGGAIFDLAVYNLTTVTGWLGPVERVTAFGGVAQPDRRVAGQAVSSRARSEDNAQILLDFGGSRFLAITTGFCMQQYQGPGIELYGTQGTLHLLGEDWDPDGYEIWRNADGCWARFKETDPEWPWTDGLRHFVACLRGLEQPRTRLDHVLHVLEVMIAARTAARSGRSVRIRSRFGRLDFGGDNAGFASVPAHRVHDRTRSHAAAEGTPEGNPAVT